MMTVCHDYNNRDLRQLNTITWKRGNSVATAKFRSSKFHSPRKTVRPSNVNMMLTTHTHTHPFNGPMPGTTQVSQYQKGKTNLDFAEARDSEWQWHQLGYMQVCTSLQIDNHASTPPLSFLQTGCPSCCPNNSIKVYS